tara:strand:+ start:1275 stop:1520 length:246 start_codon:yes stop_codon:yes gene_type:complete
VEQEGEQRLVVGDLVIGRYDLQYYSYFYDELAMNDFMGIIINFSWDTNDDLSSLFYGPYFEVHCIDGRNRFFIESELEKIS